MASQRWDHSLTTIIDPFAKAQKSINSELGWCLECSNVTTGHLCTSETSSPFRVSLPFVCTWSPSGQTLNASWYPWAADCSSRSPGCFSGGTGNKTFQRTWAALSWDSATNAVQPLALADRLVLLQFWTPCYIKLYHLLEVHVVAWQKLLQELCLLQRDRLQDELIVVG